MSDSDTQWAHMTMIAKYHNQNDTIGLMAYIKQHMNAIEGQILSMTLNALTLTQAYVKEHISILRELAKKEINTCMRDDLRLCLLREMVSSHEDATDESP
jgi:hypothetical protein